MSNREPLSSQPKSPDEILSDLLEGNKRYTESLKQNGGASVDIGNLPVHNGLSAGLIPSAAIVSCADSRVTPEAIFDSSIGELFIVRTAGNVVDPANYNLLGSLEFGVMKLGARLIMILGHSGCGAVAGAIEFEKNNTEFPGSINKLVQTIVPSVASVKGENGDLWENSIKANVKSSVQSLRKSAPQLSELENEGELKIIGACFDLDTGAVTLVS